MAMVDSHQTNVKEKEKKKRQKKEWIRKGKNEKRGKIRTMKKNDIFLKVVLRAGRV